MGKRSCASNPAVIDLEHEGGVALRSSERRALQVASNTGAAMSLLALRTELPSVCSEAEGFPLNKPLFPLQPQGQVNAVKYSASSVTDDEDETNKSKVVASKQRPDMFQVGPSITKLALRKPILSTAGTRRREIPTLRKVPFGRPIPAAPILPSLLIPRRVIPSTNNSGSHF
jgi:hypothetical protein